MRALDRIGGYAHVAARFGLEEAIFLDSIMFWYKENKANDRNFRDGRWWTFNSVSAFGELFPWWTGKQLRRIIGSCREKGALLVANYNQDQRDRTAWYSPGDELLELYGLPVEGACICPNGKSQVPGRADMSAQMGKCNIDTCSNHVETTLRDPLPPKTPGGRSGAKKEGAEEVDTVLDEYAGEDRELRQRLRDFQETRAKKKKPLHTGRAARVLVRKLDELSAGDRDLKLVLLDNAILHGWESVYPLKADEMPQGNTPPDGGVRPEGGRWL